MLTGAALAAGLLAATAGTATTARLPVVVVPELELSDLASLQGRGAVGLLVPAAGPTVSERTARAALVRGRVENSLRGGIPPGAPLIAVTTARTLPRLPAIVLALPEAGPRPNDRRYPIAVLGGTYRGLLTSRQTRIPGLVSVADVAPTALGRHDGLGWQEKRGAAGALVELDRRIRAHSEARVPAMLLTAALVAALAAAAPRAGVLAFATVLLANVVLGALGTNALALVLPAVVLAAVAAVPLARVLRTPLAVGLGLAAAVAAYLAAFAVDGTVVALSPLGPTQNARFYGLSNLLETLLLVPAFAGAAFTARRLGPAAFAAVAALALVTVAGNRFGADGGGAVVLASGYALLAVGLAGARRRVLAVALPLAAALALALVGIDAATGASSHVTRALAGGPAELAGDLADRLVVSYRRATDPWPLAIAILAAIAGLVLVVRATMRRPLARGDRALLLAFATAVAVSLLVNDSPLEVSLFGLVGSFAVARAVVQPRGMLPETRRARPVWPIDRQAISRRGGRTGARAPRR